MRDILQENRRPARIAETLDHIERWFDLVLVHGDPRLSRLEASFPEAARFADKILYTGLVAPAPLEPVIGGRVTGPAVVVSAGGGAVGAPLLEAALLARARTRLANKPWLVLTGPNMAAGLRERLAALAGPGVALQSFVPDLARVLRTAELSISQAGYNTVADVLVAGCRAVLAPYAADGETEQTTRAGLLDEAGIAVCLGPDELDPTSFAAAVDRALACRPAAHSLNLDGAGKTARLIAERRQGRAAQR